MHHRRIISNLLPRTPHTISSIEARLRPHLPPPALAILETPLWRSAALSPSGDERLVFPQNARSDLFSSAKSGPEKHEASVAMTILSKRLGMILKDFCDVCCYSRPRCVCDVVRKVRSRHTLWVVQNVGEFGRLNNSGRLLPMLVDGARISTQGLRCEADEIAAVAEAERESAVVLFPTPDAITIEEYQEERRARLGLEQAEAPLTIFIPDGTSSQAKNIEKHMPRFLQRVRLNTNTLQSWLDPIRRQTEEHRVCTAQAGATVLAELGEVEVAERANELVNIFVQRAEDERYSMGRRAGGAGVRRVPGEISFEG